MRASSTRVEGPAIVMIQQGSLNRLRMPQRLQLSTHTTVFSLDGPALRLASVACAPSGRHTVITADERNSDWARCAMVMDAQEARICVKTTQVASSLYDGPWHAAWSPNGRFLILNMKSRTNAGMICVIDTASWKEVACLRLPFKSDATITWWAADGCSILASSWHRGRNVIRIIDLCC